MSFLSINKPSGKKPPISDKGGRRQFANRRCFSYGIFIPNRRSGMDRRNGLDRRIGLRHFKNEIVTTQEKRRLWFKLIG
jgi:hypothetical protein